MRDIIGKRKITYTFSLCLMAISVGALVAFGLNLGADFVGGTQMKVKASEQGKISYDVVCAKLPEGSCTESFKVQQSGENEVIIKYRDSDDAFNTLVVGALTEIDPEHTLLETYFIGATVSEQLKGNALTAIMLVIAVILLYISWAFRRISFPVSSWSYGFTAIVALVHDVLIVLGVFAVLGKFFDVEVGIPFVAALLTILGYSVNDTIVVYDRVRENILRTKNTKDFAALLNMSLNETLARSLNTSLTVVVVLVAMIFWGSSSLVWFSLALLIGVVAGTYSSIFVATALVTTIYGYKKKKGLLK